MLSGALVLKQGAKYGHTILFIANCRAAIARLEIDNPLSRQVPETIEASDGQRAVDGAVSRILLLYGAGEHRTGHVPPGAGSVSHRFVDRRT